MANVDRPVHGGYPRPDALREAGIDYVVLSHLGGTEEPGPGSRIVTGEGGGILLWMSVPLDIDKTILSLVADDGTPYKITIEPHEE